MLNEFLTRLRFFIAGKNHADVDEDGTIYINELDMYAFARVRQLSHGMQHSTTSLPPGIRPFPLATVTKSP